jgi:hypothetical protein
MINDKYSIFRKRREMVTHALRPILTGDMSEVQHGKNQKHKAYVELISHRDGLMYHRI